jgi:hypothetical protein
MLQDEGTIWLLRLSRATIDTLEARVEVQQLQNNKSKPPGELYLARQQLKNRYATLMEAINQQPERKQITT